MIAINEARRTVNVTLSLSGLDYGWLAAYAQATGSTIDEAASKGLAYWLEGEGCAFIEKLQESLQKKTKSSGNVRKRRAKKTLAVVIPFPSPATL
jgi:hypothetical protein